MILDRLVNITRYLGIHPNLDTAIRFLETRDVFALPEGKTEVDGEQVFVMVSSPQLGDNRTWEKHRQYADIQIALRDGERIAWAEADALQGFDGYDTKRGDIQLSADPTEGIVMPINRGCFALYFPHDAHRPGIGSGMTRKAVVKVRVC